MTFDSFFALLVELYGTEPWPKPLHKLQGLERVRQGEQVSAAARAVNTTKAALEEIIVSPDPVASVLDIGFDALDEPHRRKAKQALGQMLLGKCAEETFEQIYRSGT